MMSETYAPGEIAALGKKLYEEKVRPHVAPADRMKYLVIEVQSGDYRLDADEERAFAELEALHPGGAFYFVRGDGKASAFIGAW